MSIAKEVAQLSLYLLFDAVSYPRVIISQQARILDLGMWCEAQIPGNESLTFHR